MGISYSIDNHISSLNEILKWHHFEADGGKHVNISYTLIPNSLLVVSKYWNYGHIKRSKMASTSNSFMTLWKSPQSSSNRTLQIKAPQAAD